MGGGKKKLINMLISCPRPEIQVNYRGFSWPFLSERASFSVDRKEGGGGGGGAAWRFLAGEWPGGEGAGGCIAWGMKEKEGRAAPVCPARPQGPFSFYPEKEGKGQAALALSGLREAGQEGICLAVFPAPVPDNNREKRRGIACP